MPNDTYNPGWRDHWPTDEGIVLLLRHAAYLHHRQLDAEYEEIAASTDKVAVSPEARAQLINLIKQARSKAAKARRTAFVRKAVVAAAIVIICLLAVPTALFAVSPTFRSFVLDWYEGHVDITIDGGAQDGAEQGFIRYYVPTYIPEGFVLDNVEDDIAFVELAYINGNQYIHFNTSSIETATSLDTETATIDQENQINGRPAIVKESENSVSILWHDDVTAFHLKTSLPKEIALEIAESVQRKESL